MKKIISYISVIAISVMIFASCTGDLDQIPVTKTTSKDVYSKASNYKSVLAKIYASYVIAGQEKGGGNADISSNSGYDLMRGLFNLEEASTDELASTWLEGDNIGNLTYMTWDANDPWVSDVYYRLYYTIALSNEFIRNAADGKISGFTDAEQTEIKNERNEARFLRALSYYYVLDLFGQGPFVTENDPVGAYTPKAYTNSQLFSYIESELKDVEANLPSPSECEYGRASSAAAAALLAKLYLNAVVFDAGDHYTDCITYCKKVIADGFHLDSDYSGLFNADNNKRTDEIIFPFVVDAGYTMSWGATTYIICGEVGSTSSQKADDYGVTSPWGMFRLRGELPELFADKTGTTDKRAMFYTDGQTQWLDKAIDDQTQGYFCEKWSNLKDDGTAASNTTSDGVSTDFPVFRLSDVYLMLAESVIRGGTGATRADALGYLNLIRERAYGDNSGDITDADMTLDYILKERARELYWECVRRTDLIRFGVFTGKDYLWQWKGGAADGKNVDSKYNIYPIPATELSANPNLQNENY
ncbi:MAG: RagB/SusD family nutrient uptake outer membrane protein [Bacteroidales bacterium]|jgi:hypothetical protein|nr:RagB/SusD family nutrient uptake outer membrane protein [Bacteroidales bacterium]